MRNKLLLALSLGILVAAVSCKNKAGSSGMLIPKDAIFVAHINSSSLLTKLSWEDIKKSEWFKKMAVDNTDSLSRVLLENPENSGIDLKGAGFTVFVKKQGTGGYFAFAGDLKDAAAFEKFVKAADKNKPEVMKSGDLSYIKTDDAILTWTNSRFISVGNASMAGMNPMSMMNGGGYQSQKFSADSLLMFAKNTYALSGDALLDNNEKFADLMKTDGDAHFFYSAENVYSGFASMFKFGDLMKDNIGTATLNFENGQIVLNGKQYVGEQLANIMDKYKPTAVSKEALNRLPAGDVLFAASLNYPMEGILELLKVSGADGAANGALGELGITVQDITNAFTGEAVVAIPPMTITPEVSEYEDADGKKVSHTYNKTSFNYVGGMGIKNKSAFDKVWGAMMKMMRGETPKDVVIRNENNWMVFSNADPSATAFLAGNNKPSYVDKLSGHVFGMFVDINKIMSSTMYTRPDAEMDSVEVAMKKLSLETWKDGLAYGDYKKGESTFHMEINLSDKSMNSLKQINQYGDKMAALTEIQSNKWKQKWNDEAAVDSIEPVAPPMEQK